MYVAMRWFFGHVHTNCAVEKLSNTYLLEARLFEKLRNFFRRMKILDRFGQISVGDAIMGQESADPWD